MTIDVQLGDIGHGLLGSSQLSTINQSELGLGLSAGNILLQTNSPDQPLSATASPAGSLQDDDMDDFRVRRRPPPPPPPPQQALCIMTDLSVCLSLMDEEQAMRL